jgi:hypothetical protein
VFDHEDGQTPRFPTNTTLACEVDQFPAKALMECVMTQKFIEQIVGDLLVMNSGCEPRRNQRNSPEGAKVKTCEIKWKAYVLTPKAFANFRPKVGTQQQPWVET